jgi:uncharacterized protein
MNATPPTIDFWANLRSPAATTAWQSIREFREAGEARGSTDSFKPRGPRETLADMDGCGIDASIISGLTGIEPLYPQHNYAIDEVLAMCEQHPTRLLAAMTVEGLGSVSAICRQIEAHADHQALALVRVVPMFVHEPINSPRLYPVYERCEALGIPVSINVGVPGPRVSAAYQDAMLLDDVLIDFPELTVVAAHMGHPWERLLIRFMRKYPRLYLSNSAWLAKYLDPDVVRFMDSSVGRSRLIFASDAPLIAPARAIEAARELPISEAAMKNFLGANALQALGPRAASLLATQDCAGEEDPTRGGTPCPASPRAAADGVRPALGT